MCRHFGVCGGCSLQHLSAAEYLEFKRTNIQNALAKAGVTAEVLTPIRVQPGSRRRTVLKWKPGAIGFHAAQSHTIVDMQECLVLTPGIFRLARMLRDRLLFLGEPCEIHITETLTGFDLAFRSPEKISTRLTADMAKALDGLSVARAVFNGSLVMETSAPEIEEAGIRLKLAPHAFLQPTLAGEVVLQQRVCEVIGNAKSVADLFSGCGTFALPLAKKAKVHAVEQDKAALGALAEAAKTPGLKPVTVEARDLFRQPLTVLELASYQAVVLDPPRAGALTQVQTLRKSKVPTIAYVSCDASSFARDAAVLLAGGYRMGAISPIDQFLWSSHIELVAGFSRSC